MESEIKEKIIEIIKNAVRKGFKIEMDSVNVEHPADSSFGDYSVNTAFKLSKHLKKNPKEVAEDLLKEIQKKKDENIEKIEVAGGGFVNFYLSPEFFKKSLEYIKKSGDKWGANGELKESKVVVEYTDPNPFKEFHVGHLMSNTIGESISRIIEFSGAKTKRANYQGDVGMHVAKAIWGILNSKLKPNKVEDLNKAYAKGAEAYKRSEKANKEINEINKKIYEESDRKINSIYKKGKKASLQKFEKIYKKLGTKFDRYFFESEVAGPGKKIVEDNLKAGIFEESEGAIVFRGDLYGLHTRVFVNSEGIPTYESKEIALFELKDEEFSPDMSVVVTGSEIEGYFKVVKKAMEFISPNIAAYTKHVPHGMMRLKTGKISSREGNVPLGENLLEEVYKKALKKIERGAKRTAEIVAVGAIKYSILKRTAGKDAIFDIDQALSFEGDSGAYLQYSYTRAKSVLEKAKKQKIKSSCQTGQGKKIKTSKETREIERFLYRFPEVVKEAKEDLEPRAIAGYLTELASLFNAFYAKEKIVDKEDKESAYKVLITEATLITLKNGLWLLGIEAPEKM